MKTSDNKNITFRYIHPKVLSSQERKQLSKLHTKHGMMWSAFEKFQSDRKTKVVLATVNNSVVGWTLVFVYPDSLAYPNNKRIKYRHELHAYVKFSFRKRGIGKQMINIVNRYFKKEITVYPWNVAGDRLYKYLKNGNIV